MVTEYKTPLSVRGDCLYCPLPFSIDSYYTCHVNCHHCYFRRLNRTWGNDLRVTDPRKLELKLLSGLKNPNPKSALAHCISKKKTIRIGNKSDPLQPCEDIYKATLRIMKSLLKLKWSFLIQTRFPSKLLRDPYRRAILSSLSAGQDLITIMPVISPGLSRDWEVLERKRTDPISKRLEVCRYFSRKNVSVGVNGEPFIPGFHTVADFEKTIRLLKANGVKSYNTYNFHWNDFTAKRLHAIGIDIEKIWYYNRDEYWKPILQQLLDIAKKHGIILGCPDFVNTGSDYREPVNTCCGVQVKNPSTFNTHYFKNFAQGGQLTQKDIEGFTWEGIGDLEEGKKIISGAKCDMYTLRDADVLNLMKKEIE